MINLIKIVIFNKVKSPANKLNLWESDLQLIAGPAPIEEKGSLDQVLWQGIIKIHNNHKDAMLTYEKAACDHQVAEVLAGHQRDGALLLELPGVVINQYINY